MKEIINIGSMIENEVRKQQLDITKFASLIYCSRKNVYDIFTRNDIKIDLLRRISQVLNHNFFMDLALNPELANPAPINEKELQRIKAVNQFLEVVPKVFEDLGIDAAIVFGTRQGVEEDVPLPDFILGKYNITFTIGQTYEEKCNGYWGPGMTFYHASPEPANMMVGNLNNATGFQSWDIAIDYKTEDEWRETIVTALELIENYYLPRTWADLKQDY